MVDSNKLHGAHTDTVRVLERLTLHGTRMGWQLRHAE